MEKDLKDIFVEDPGATVQTPKTGDPKKKKIWTIAIVCAVVLALAVCFTLGFILGSNTGINQDMPLLIEAYQYIKEYYYKDISWNEFQEIAAAAMAGSLDRFSGMVSVDNGSGQSGSFGLFVTSTVYNEHEISFIVPGTYNYNAKAEYKYDIKDGKVTSEAVSEEETVQLREGDRIYGLMSVNTETQELTPVVFENADTSYMTSVLSAVGGDAIFIFKKYDGNGGYFDGYYGIKLKRIYDDSVSKTAFYYNYTDDIGIIKLLEFSAQANLDFEECVNSFVADGKKKLILDLRNNGGGEETSLQFIAQYLCKNPTDTSLPLIKLISNSGGGKMVENVSYSSKAGGAKESYYLGNVIDGFEVVVLVNGNSASASEALIGALEYYNDVEIVGTTTFGKGVAQRKFILSNGDVLYVTNGTYYVPTADNSGNLVWEKCIHGVGFTPSEENTVEDKVAPYDVDACTQRAVEILNS